jgi:hypothetical protein
MDNMSLRICVESNFGTRMHEGLAFALRARFADRESSCVLPCIEVHGGGLRATSVSYLEYTTPVIFVLKNARQIFIIGLFNAHLTNVQGASDKAECTTLSSFRAHYSRHRAEQTAARPSPELVSGIRLQRGCLLHLTNKRLDSVKIVNDDADESAERVCG